MSAIYQWRLVEQKSRSNQLQSDVEGDLPPISKIARALAGAFIATGHTCWGILNSPGTGAAMAELILDGVASVVDLTPFDPARFF